MSFEPIPTTQQANDSLASDGFFNEPDAKDHTLQPAAQALHRFLTTTPTVRRFLIAFSGGMDSQVLLHWLVHHWDQRGDPHMGCEMRAVYIHHGLHPNATDWGQACEAVCTRYGVPFQQIEVQVHRDGRGIEAAARQARYQAFAQQLNADEVLLTAHHRDDQAETVLLQWLRGAGVAGLAAMPECAPLGQGQLWRPFLAIWRATLADYAQAHHLTWIDDPSNADPRFDRNYLRHTILPLLRTRWPAVSDTLTRTAQWCAEAHAGVTEQAAADLAAVQAEPADCTWTAHTAPGASTCLAIERLQALSYTRQRAVLRHWLRCLRLPSPSAVQLEHLMTHVLGAACDRIPLMHWPGVEVRRYRQRLYAFPPLPAHLPTHVIAWPDLHRPLTIPGIGHLSWRAASGGVDNLFLARTDVTVRFRKGGETLKLAGACHHRTLKNLMQEAAIPPWQRHRLPLLYVYDQLAVVADRWVAAPYAALPPESGWFLQLHPIAAHADENTGEPPCFITK